MEQLIQKENDIFEILQSFIDAKLEFVVVGGYAVSAYKHRFSVDADIVIKSEHLSEFEKVLTKNGFKKTISKDLENMYSSRFIRYEKEQASVDILIDAVACRGTNASFGYDLLYKNSISKRIIGIEKEVLARIPTKEILIVMKVHSGRLTDFRDVAALAKDLNLETIRKFLFIGDIKILKENMEKIF
jgi:hypothetical protein